MCKPVHCSQQNRDQKFEQMFESIVSIFYGLINGPLINMGSTLKFKVELRADCQINESSDALASNSARKLDFRKCK